MHRSHKKNPSKVCQDRYDEYCAKLHKEKLAQIKPSVDNTPPKAQVHLEHRRKRDQITEERLSTIEKHNLLLLNKMMDIMKKPSSIPKPSSPSGPKSLNKEVRKRNLDDIKTENKALLKRLQSAKAYYDHNDWDSFGKTQESYLQNICEYPVVKNAKPTSPTNGTATKTSKPSSTQNAKSPAKPSQKRPANTTKPKTKSTTNGNKKKSIRKSKPKDTEDSDSLQLSDIDDGDIGTVAAAASNLDIHKK